MKLKKLFAGILAVAMMATMAAPAFAARTPSSYTTNGDSKIAVSEDGSFTIKKAYAPNNGATAPNETFTLTATKVSVSNSSIKEADFKATGAYEVRSLKTARLLISMCSCLIMVSRVFSFTN